MQTPLTPKDVYLRIAQIKDPIRRAEAATLAAIAFKGARSMRRDSVTRAKYAGDPWRYFADVLGYSLTKQQEQALEMVEKYDRVLVASANNVGKTFLLAGYQLYRFDAVAALPDEESGMKEQGARILLSGPDHATIFNTVWSEILVHASRAERRGFPMPQNRSEKSIYWRVRAMWNVESFSPPKTVTQEVTHSASGRHHRNMVALIEEGQGVIEPVWRAIEGMCSAAGNKILSSFNPTEARGPTYDRSKSGVYRTLHLSALDHPNILTRSIVVPSAVGFTVIDDRVKMQCRDRGRSPGTSPDPHHSDFVYALPPEGAEEHGPREDGVPGHPDGEPRVYRPNATFEAQGLGVWPTSSERTLFSSGAIERAMQRWKARKIPDRMPDRVGADLAWKDEGGDDIIAAPCWGGTAGDVIREFKEAEAINSDLANAIRNSRRLLVGELQTLSNGRGPDVAEELVHRFPRSFFVLDQGGVGTSTLDHMVRMMPGVQVAGIAFAGSPPEPILVRTPKGLHYSEDWTENMRTSMYLRCAIAVELDLIDLPPDPLLRQELMAHSIEPRSRIADVREGSIIRKQRVASVILVAKDEVKKLIGRSPDRADALVLALTDPMQGRVKAGWA